MYTNPFNRKHCTIRQVLDRLLDPTRKQIMRSTSVSSSSSSSNSSSSITDSIITSFMSNNRRERSGISQWKKK
ncbi:hypothetical protein PV325_010563 [Microctonus aethiopoides]|nr:hypothetical protein PV325_010563 [Microctonus aethiopoides]KAK0098037.1 hypothetical protein PV326_011572 [Microctonus aethiopoides]